ncbi:hypothetical protein, variant [Aphanomyces invadans]|uniref:Uncharacterized protein n=1 Tax=Aphanomyces invadans TaxID=157072 RepID=A0A024U1W6_9STRA|nr:hypothetical protein, variant [Aphanomyces invadans]ETW00220.1 hypothetical protein, variant [Aphanomyces invadans]|eukprot:XP_008871245.1 hypothetical protein, variant [Aphanomyces invadans]
MPRRHHGETSSEAALPQPPLVEMVFLGTASMVSSSTRHVSGIGVAIGGDCWIFDAGEGTGTQLAKSAVLQSAVSRVFVTHMHGDHVFGLMGLLLSVGCTGEPRIIQVVGPPGLRKYLRRNLADTESNMLCQYRVDELWFGEAPASDIYDADPLYVPMELPGLNVAPLNDGTWRVPPPPSTGKLHPRHQHIDNSGNVEETFFVCAAPLKHTLEPCYAFVIQERDYPGRVHLTSDLKSRLLAPDNQEFLQRRDISNPLAVLTALQHGHSVELVDGTLLPEDVLSERRIGRRLAILGDTCDSRAVARLAVGADVVVSWSTSPSSEMESFVGARMHERLHRHVGRCPFHVQRS